MRKIDVYDIVGMKFGKLTVLDFAFKRNIYYYYLCKCECGNTKTIIRGSLINGDTKSCGCYCKEVITKHLLINHPLYKKWSGMKYRCYNKKCKYFYCYGGKSIKVCNEWLTDFKSFYDWAVNNGYKKGLTLDRIDVNGDYEPSNCRWVDDKIQANNRTNNHFLTYNNETHTISEWCNITGLPYSTLSHRIARGWDIEKALTTI